MSADLSKLIYSPPIQNIFIDPSTGYPADGELKFYADGTNTPKNAYIFSGDPQNPYVAVTTLALNGAGSPDKQLYLYLWEEADSTISQLYRVVATDSQGVEVVIKDSFPFGYVSSSVTPGSSEVATNLFGSYGFDQRLFDGVFTDLNPMVVPFTQFFSGGGWALEIESTNTAQRNYYEFTTLVNSGIPLNPKNSVTIHSQNNSSGDSLKYIKATIGDYNCFQNTQLGFSLYIRVVNGLITSIPIKLIRENTLGVETISVGNLVVTNLLEQQTLFFTVPPITTTTHVNGNQLYLALDMPLNQDYSVELTATWLQQSPDNKLLITEENRGIDVSVNLFQAGKTVMEADYTVKSAGLPAVYSNGYVVPSYDTGKIDLFPLSTPDAYVEGMRVALNGATVFFKNQPYGTTKVLPNRLIEHSLTAPLLRRSQRTFEAPVTNNEVTIQTAIGTKQLRAASVSAGGRITHTVVENELLMAVEAYIDPNKRGNWDIINLIWKDNGSVTSGMLTPPNVAGTITRSFLYDNGTTPIIANYLGVFNTITSRTTPSNNSQTVYYVGNDVYPGIQGTASTPASAQFNIGASRAHVVQYAYSTVLDDPNVRDRPVPPGGGYLSNGANNNAEHLRYRTIDVPGYPGIGGTEYSNMQFIEGFLAWQDPGPGNAPITAQNMNGVYKYILRFQHDGIASPLPTVAAGGVDRTVVTSKYESPFDRAYRTLQTINNPRLDRFTVVSTPQTGDYGLIDNGASYFQFIMVEDSAAKPAALPGEIPIYVSFSASDTIDQIAQKISLSVRTAVLGVPDYRNMGIAVPSPDLMPYVYL